MRIGVDLGGTKIEALALSGDAVHERRRIATPRGDYDATVRAIVSVVGEIEAGAGVSARVGIAHPGALTRAGTIKNANSVWLNGRPLGRDLETALGRPVRLANDADCLAVSEAADGAGRDATSVFAAILGTGVGAGIVVHGRLLSGPNGIAGEWGHNPLPRPRTEESPGPPCYCGRRGCIETFLSGAALAALGAAFGLPHADAETVAARAAAGEDAATHCMALYEDRLARALASVVNILDPDVIVLGGGLSNIARLYTTLPPLLASHVFSDTFATPVRAAAHGDASGVRGAARLWPERPDSVE